MRTDDNPGPGEVRRRPNRFAAFIFHALLPTAVVAAGIFLTMYLVNTSPKAEPRKRPPTATLVEVEEVKHGVQQTVITGMGEVIPAREIDLKPRVSGAIIGTSAEFIPGGLYQKGEMVLQLDPADYELAVNQLQSDFARADSELLLEMGNQRIAAREFEILNEQVSQEEKALILRKPQLSQLEAARLAAGARLQQARLDLERTRVKIPFNSVIASRNVDTGARVNESTVLAHLVGTDTFWLRLSLPVEQLKWLRIPGNQNEVGSTVRIYPQGSTELFRTGRVIRLAASLEEQGRMAQVLVEVDDPLSLQEENSGAPQLLLGSYVKAEIDGISIPAGVKISREHIHDGRFVWLMTGDGRLDIREVDILFRNRDQVIIHNSIGEDERLITSSLSSPVAGIPLRLEADTPSSEQRNTSTVTEGATKSMPDIEKTGAVARENAGRTNNAQ